MPDTRRKHYEYDPNLSGTLTQTAANTNASQQAVADNNAIAHFDSLSNNNQENPPRQPRRFFLQFLGRHVM
jgi:hypothetical protein